MAAHRRLSSVSVSAERARHVPPPHRTVGESRAKGAQTPQNSRIRMRTSTITACKDGIRATWRPCLRHAESIPHCVQEPCRRRRSGKHLQLQMTDGAEHLQLQMTVTVMPKTRRLRFLIPAHVHLYARTCFTGLQRLERRRVCMKKGRQAIACLPCSNYWRKVRDSNPRYP